MGSGVRSAADRAADRDAQRSLAAGCGRDRQGAGAQGGGGRRRPERRRRARHPARPVRRRQGHEGADRRSEHHLRRAGGARVHQAESGRIGADARGHRRHDRRDRRDHRRTDRVQHHRPRAGRGDPARTAALADPVRGRAGRSRDHLPLWAEPRAGALALGQLGRGRRDRHLDARLHRVLDLRPELRQLQRDLRLARRRRHPADVVLAVGLHRTAGRRAQLGDGAPDRARFDHGPAEAARPTRRLRRRPRRRGALITLAGLALISSTPAPRLAFSAFAGGRPTTPCWRSLRAPASSVTRSGERSRPGATAACRASQARHRCG